MGYQHTASIGRRGQSHAHLPFAVRASSESVHCQDVDCTLLRGRTTHRYQLAPVSYYHLFIWSVDSPEADVESNQDHRSLADVLLTTLQVDMVVMMMSSSWVSHRERCIVLPHAQSSNTVGIVPTVLACCYCMKEVKGCRRVVDVVAAGCRLAPSEDHLFLFVVDMTRLMTGQLQQSIHP